MRTPKQRTTPLLSQLLISSQRRHAGFYTPGHKQGKGASAALRSLLTKFTLAADLPELPELDNLFAPEHVIAEAQDLAAQLYGADTTYFLANGSTCGIEAAVLATCNPGDRILIPRNAHRSVLSALVLSGAMPIYLQPAYDADWDLAGGIDPQAIATALDTYSDIRAVLLVSPTYHGICSDLKTVAAIAHSRNIPLLVDEAHGAHFGFYPELPESAIAAGADIAVQSTHKTLGALTQAAMLHIQGNQIDRDRLNQALQLTQSTSPNYLLLASLDAARQQMAVEGQFLIERTLKLAIEAHQTLSKISDLRVFELADAAPPGFFDWDATRLTVDVSHLGITGFDADEWLHSKAGVTAELPALKHLTFIISLGNTAEDIEQLASGFTRLTKERHNSSTPSNKSIKVAHPPEDYQSASLPSRSPRDAFFSKTQIVSTDKAISHISADLICPYPPGIPLIFPGEIITADAIAQLQDIQAAGGIILGSSDAQLNYWRVICQ
ncbi:MAG: aminotransferase class I/II-fold pyridoxal phosphate-dependent enzyme [Cyanobacteria bacterium P01_D01_bin.128]